MRGQELVCLPTSITKQECTRDLFVTMLLPTSISSGGDISTSDRMLSAMRAAKFVATLPLANKSIQMFTKFLVHTKCNLGLSPAYPRGSADRAGLKIL